MNPNTPTIINFSNSTISKRTKYFQVFGERRSGTNFVASLISQNTHLQEVRRFGWKHGIPAYPVFPASCLFVVVVREPIEWLKAFYRAPFEVDTQIADLSFSDFIRAEWESVYTPNRSGWSGQGYDLDYRHGRGQTLQLDRHPIEGRKYRNVLELRTLKLAGQLSMLARGSNCIAVRYEAVRDDFEHLINALGEHFEVDVSGKRSGIQEHVGPKSPRANLNLEITPSDLDHIISNLDVSQEASCGYPM